MGESQIPEDISIPFSTIKSAEQTYQPKGEYHFNSI